MVNEYNNVTIEQEDGSKREYEVLAIFEIGNNNYVALLPTTENDNEIIFFGCNENISSGELELINIEDDSEFEYISNLFNTIFIENWKEDLKNE